MRCPPTYSFLSRSDKALAIGQSGIKDVADDMPSAMLKPIFIYSHLMNNYQIKKFVERS
jgi:hypothetical protein